MLNGNQRGSSTSQGGMAGRRSQSYWSNRASQSFVKTRARAMPPWASTQSRARTMCGALGSSPASFSAKYASMVVLSSPGPPYHCDQ